LHENAAAYCTALVKQFWRAVFSLLPLKFNPPIETLTGSKSSRGRCFYRRMADYQGTASRLSSMCRLAKRGLNLKIRTLPDFCCCLNLPLSI
jgi:hypothetical protein